MPNVSYCEDNRDVHYNPYVEPPFFCKLTLSDDTVVDIEGSGELTQAMTSAYSATCVSAELGDLCTSVGGDAFYESDSLSSVTIGSGVRSIGKTAFGGCVDLTSITVDSDNTVYDSRNNCNAIIESSTNKLICGCLNTVIPNSVTSIGKYAFYEIYGLTSITIPSSVTSIDEKAFGTCDGMRSVTIGSGVTSIGEYAFMDCYSLTSITVEATTPPTLGDGVFYDTNDCPIYVPSGSVSTYKAAPGWSTYASRIQAKP